MQGEKALEFVISLNLKRRHLTQSQAGVIALTILPMMEEEAKKRMTLGVNQFSPVEKIPQPSETSRSAVQAGKRVQLSEKKRGWNAFEKISRRHSQAMSRA